jgi:hypothetical protein
MKTQVASSVSAQLDGINDTLASIVRNEAQPNKMGLKEVEQIPEARAKSLRAQIASLDMKVKRMKALDPDYQPPVEELDNLCMQLTDLTTRCSVELHEEISNKYG